MGLMGPHGTHGPHGPHVHHGPQGPMCPMGPTPCGHGPGGCAGVPIPVWDSCRFARIHFQESDFRAPDLACFPEEIKRALPYAQTNNLLYYTSPGACNILLRVWEQFADLFSDYKNIGNTYCFLWIYVYMDIWMSIYGHRIQNGRFGLGVDIEFNMGYFCACMFQTIFWSAHTFQYYYQH